MCGLAPSRVLGSARLRRRRLGARQRSGCCPPARSRCVTGTSPHGQGHETAWSQIVADQLGVAFEDVEVLHGDTQVSPRASTPTDRGRSSVGGEAVVRAADKVIEKAKPIAAHLLEAIADDLEFADGRFTVRGTDKGMAIGEIAFAVFAAHDLPDGVESSTRLRRDLRPGTLLASRTAPTCARSRSTPRPAR